MRNIAAAACAAAAVLALAACGSSGHPAHHAAASHAAAPAAAALPHVSNADAGRLCADLNALVATGSSQPFATVAAADTWLPRADKAAAVAASVHEGCPQFVHLLPRQYGGKSGG